MSGRLNKIFPVARVIDTAVLVDTDVFTNDLVPTRPAVYRINVAFSAALILYITGLSATRLILNDGFALDANELYAFDIPVRNGDTINFQVSAGVTIHVFDVAEIPWGG